MIVIGIDPDSDKYGVAIYDEGKLVELECKRLVEVMVLLSSGWLSRYNTDYIEVHMENVCANNAAFQKKGVKNKLASTAINRSVGKCQQAQIELERLFEYFKIPVVKHKTSKMWKKNKVQFESVTGWNGRSNEDTRSAAYFGWLGLRR